MRRVKDFVSETDEEYEEGSAVREEVEGGARQHVVGVEIAEVGASVSGHEAEQGEQQPAENASGEFLPEDGDANRIPCRSVGYAESGEKERSGPALYRFLRLDIVKSRKLLQMVGKRIALPTPAAQPPEGSPLPAVIIINAQLPLESPSLFGQKLDGPTCNAVFCFGMTEETAAMAALPEEEQSNATRLLTKYWREGGANRELQETMKLMAFCRNIDTFDGWLVKLLKGYNGKPVLLTKSGTLYQGATNQGLSFGGMDVNMRCWAYPARKALKTCAEMIPQMTLHVALTIEGDPTRQGKDEELPEQVFGNFHASNIPDIHGKDLIKEEDYFELFNPDEGHLK